MNRLKIFTLYLFLSILIPACAPAQPDLAFLESQPAENLPVKASGLPEPTEENTEIPTAAPEIVLDPDGPRGVLESFYQWYFEQPQGEVLTQRTYQASPYLSDIWKSDLGYLLDDFKDQAGYDPFTCSQNDIPSLDFDRVFTSGGVAYALGTVEIEEEVRHYFVVQLGQGEGDWKIDAIHCPFDPQTAAMAFYTWYLGYIYNGADAQSMAFEPRNPIVDGALEDCFLISQEFSQKIDTEIAKMAAKGGAYDPILDAQTVPVEFWVHPGQEGDAIEVRLTYGPQSARYAIVRLVESMPFYWKVDDIEPVEVPVFDPLAYKDVNTADWQEYIDPDHGFSLRFPGTWATQSADLSAMPEDNPVKKGVFLIPNWADPNLPVLWLQVLEGSEQELNNYYPIENRQRVEINQSKVWVDRDRCETRFIFQHPRKTATWIVIGDPCSTLPGRERYMEELKEVMAPLLRTVHFE